MNYQDKKYLFLFIILYFIQGVPLGMWQGTLILILSEKGIPPHDLALLSLASYPFAFKILTAPILDTYFFKHLGKRRSYILPIQYIISILYFMLYLTNVSSWIDNVPILSLVGFIMILLAAHQDIAVDGWVLTAFSKEAVHYGASCQSIGQTMGAIFSTTVFISLNSIEFCNRHIYSVPQTTPILNLSTFCLLNSFITLLVTCYVHLRTTENPDPELHESVKVVLQHIKCLLYNKHVQTLLIHLLLFRLSFQPIIVSTSRVLLTHGVKKEMIAYIQTLMIPLGFLIPIMVSKLFKRGREMGTIFNLLILRHIETIFQVVLVIGYPTILMNESSSAYLILFIFGFNTAFLSNSIFITHGCLFNRVSDPLVGGTYLTFLNSFHNFGGLIVESVSYLLLDYLSYEMIALLTWLFAIGYHLMYRKKVIKLSDLQAQEWASGYKKL